MRHLRWVQRKTVVYLYGGSHVCSIFKSYTDISWFIREMPFKNENYLPAWWGALNFIANTVSDRKMTYYMKSISSTTPQKKKKSWPKSTVIDCQWNRHNLDSEWKKNKEMPARQNVLERLVLLQRSSSSSCNQKWIREAERSVTAICFCGCILSAWKMWTGYS